jgi:diaminohydroxyphosphoribosylaminopyrimidine deaminase/5-amino-6-(5-phosphoribosylamino)uracil reductase
MEDPNPQVAGQGILQCREAGIDVDVGVMTSHAEELNPGFIKRMRQGRPFVRCKMAMSMDGRTAMASGESQWITGQHSRQDVHRMRARSSAIITGIGTVLADDPSMNARLDDTFHNDTSHNDSTHNGREILQPVRVVLDSQLKMPVDARMLSLPGRTIICTSVDTDANQQTKKKSEQLKNAGAEVVQLQDDKGRISLNDLMDFLGSENINEAMLEAGAVLSGAFMRSGLVDEVIVYMAPILMGDSARGLFSLPGITTMSGAQKMKILDVRAVGDDWRITAKPEMT